MVRDCFGIYHLRFNLRGRAPLAASASSSSMSRLWHTFSASARTTCSKFGTGTRIRHPWWLRCISWRYPYSSLPLLSKACWQGRRGKQGAKVGSIDLVWLTDMAYSATWWRTMQVGPRERAVPVARCLRQRLRCSRGWLWQSNWRTPSNGMRLPWAVGPCLRLPDVLNRWSAIRWRPWSLVDSSLYTWTAFFSFQGAVASRCRCCVNR